ncbi:hypothetical protein JL720_1176 [Aureococcus anophagefferens]|nr:hypothetical protein JL720_1176 [Aureococcus anophagefferens]
MRGLPAGPGGPLRKSNGRSPASLGADIEEIDALLAASKRARTSVAERASKLMSEHAAVQRGFERELDRETLRQKPKEKLKRRSGADHALLFHLAHAGPASDGAPLRGAPRAASPRSRRRPTTPSSRRRRATRARRRRASGTSTTGSARGALLQALDRGRDAEDDAARRLAETMAELEAAPGWAALVGDVDDEADGEDADVAAEQAAEVDALDETRRKREAELAAVRRASGAEIAARLDAYDPVGPGRRATSTGSATWASSTRRRLRRPRGRGAARAARRAHRRARRVGAGARGGRRRRAQRGARRRSRGGREARRARRDEGARPRGGFEALESLSAQTESQSLASGESASASSHSGKHHHHHRHHHKKAPGSPGSHHGSHHGHHHLPGASVAAEMAEIIKQDEHVASMMHELPSNPDGLIDAQTGKAQLMSEIVAEHTVRVDLSFPSLESFRRAEHDVASYFMPDYSAHLSEPHGGGGGFWSGVRAETRRARLAPDDESHSTGSHRRPRHGGAGHQRSHDADEVRAHGLEPALPGHQPAERPEASPTATLDTLLREGVACLATLPLPGLARDALELPVRGGGRRLRRGRRRGARGGRRAARGAERVRRHGHARGRRGPHRLRHRRARRVARGGHGRRRGAGADGLRVRPLLLRVRGDAHFLSAAPEGSEVRPPPVSFAHLAAFCATAARLEHDSGMELVARSEKAALAADDALACLDEPGEHTVKGLLEQEGLLGPAQDKFRDFVTSPAFRAAVQAQTNKQLAKHGGLGAAAAWRVVLAARDALANQAAVRVDVAAATDPEDGADATARCFDIIEENKQHHHTQTVHHGRRRISIVDTASRFTEFATFALLRAALRERRDDARRDAAAELAYVDLARCPPSAEQGCLDVVHRLVDLGALPASAARLLGSAELARGLDAALARRDAQRARSSHHASAGPRGHQAWDATGRELKLVFDEVAAATDARLPTPKSPDRCALYGALFDARARARGGPRDATRASLRAAPRRARDVALRRRFGARARAAAAGEALEDEDHEPAAPLRAAEEPSAFDAYGEPHAPAAPQSYALSALVFPGRAASSTTLDAADLPATVDQDRLPAELVRRATFDDSDLLEPLKLPRAAAANGN